MVVNHSKNDQEHKGHWMRFCQSSDPELDLHYQLGLFKFTNKARTLPSAACAAAQLRGKRCLTSSRP